ncbi:hypothetical protein J4377_09685 [Halomonas sp. XH26]|uniref:Uncharacterized protein n=2 Tax=Halomonadaceae TaxID=28256 RepID=A0AAJ2RU50_9GAMM|nr:MULTISPECIES: hypothetical protein [Halomonas]MDX5976211.1 hypothetical protein [Halomonas alkaliphila]UTA78259.1 hypothetical protein J4377_09685 [Halomonas sp. XH26]UYV17614.1 hypothetical protein K1Y77_08830 [Halomonas qaidamensis]
MTNDLAEITVYMTKHPERGPRLFVKAKGARLKVSRSVTMAEAIAIWRGEFPESLSDMMTEAQFRGYQAEFVFQADMYFQHLGAEIDLSQ